MEIEDIPPTLRFPQHSSKAISLQRGRGRHAMMMMMMVMTHENTRCRKLTRGHETPPSTSRGNPSDVVWWDDLWAVGETRRARGPRHRQMPKRRQRQAIGGQIRAKRMRPLAAAIDQSGKPVGVVGGTTSGSRGDPSGPRRPRASRCTTTTTATTAAQ